MTSRKEHPGQERQHAPNRLETPGHGPDGVDKAPGEETAQDNVQFKQEAFGGKKVDADPDEEQDQPLDHQEL